MKIFFFIVAVFSFGQINSMAVFADEGTICNEMKIRLKAIKALQAQNFIGIRFGGAGVWIKPDGPMGERFEAYLQKIAHDHEEKGNDLTAIMASVPTKAYVLPIMVNKQAFNQASSVDSDANDNLCGADFTRKDGSSEKVVVYIDDKGRPIVREVDRDYLRQVEENKDINMDDRHPGEAVTEHHFPENPTILDYRGEGVFNMSGDDVKIEMMKMNKTFFLDAKDALPLIGELINGGDTKQRYLALIPLYFYLKDES